MGTKPIQLPSKEERMIDTKSAVSQRLSKYAVLSATAAVAATGTASAAVQIVTLAGR